MYFKSATFEDNPPRNDLLGLAGRYFFPVLGYTFGFLGYHHVHSRDQKEELFPVLAKMRALVDRFEGVLVGETEDFPSNEYDNAAQYCGHDKLHMAFNFRLLESEWSATAFSQGTFHVVPLELVLLSIVFFLEALRRCSSHTRTLKSDSGLVSNLRMANLDSR